MKHDDVRFDLSPLDPENDPRRLERVVEGVLERIGPGLVPEDFYSMTEQVARQLARRFRPLFSAAAMAAAVAGVLFFTRPDVSSSRGTSPGSDLVEFPAEVERWLTTGEAPEVEDLLFSLAGGIR
jgi:hypothetical protein